MSKQNDSTRKPSSPALEPKTPEEQKEAEEVKPPTPLEVNPTTKTAEPLITGAPKIEVAQPNPPTLPTPTQKQIPINLQLEAIGKAICKNSGHKIIALYLRQTAAPSKEQTGPLLMHESTVVVCEHCGASLAQIRG